MSDHNLRFPPDSTGKRVGHLAYVDIEFNNGTIPFNIGDIISTPTTLISGTITKVTGNTSVGMIHVLLLEESPEAVNIGEALQVGGVTKATAVTAGIPIFVQKTATFGANNLNYGQHVDAKGAASVRFTEGEPQFDAYGRLQNAFPETVAEYVNRYDDLPAKFTTILTGGGNSVYNSTQKSVVLSCGTASGDKVVRRSNVWHKNQTGISQLVEMSTLLGDAGKTNVRRRWGYYDDNFGIRFEQDGLITYAVYRSSTSGSLIEIKIPQSQWNFDRVDGSKESFNLSSVALDVSKINNFWFDIMCSAGSARCGVTIDNVRITCHKFAIGNIYGIEHLAVGTLPITWEQENTGTSVSTSEMRVYCSVVKSEGPLSSPYKTFAGDNGTNVTVASDTVYTPLFSGRAKQLFKTLSNRLYALPCEVDVITTTTPIIVELVKNATLTGATWAGDAGTESCMEMDMAASAATGGLVMCSHIVKDIKTLDLSKMFNNDAEIISRKAVITDTPDIYTFRAKTVSNATTTSVRLSVNWRET